MKNITIKLKLVIIFIAIKIIPLIIISYTIYEGISHLEKYLEKSTRYLFNESKQVILSTANESIDLSVKSLDEKSQLSIERHSSKIAINVAEFLYERDNDLLFLSKLDINKELINAFYQTKNKDILIHEDYKYDDKSASWKSTLENKENKSIEEVADLEDNKKAFHKTQVQEFISKSIPIYKEISYFNIQGKEQYKISQINDKLLDISNKQNTYINSETYFSKISDLKEGEIYVSDVIGEYIKSKVIGTFNKPKAQKAKIAFEPEKSAYAGKENPVGKRFEGIIRFITPVFKNSQKTGYISLALNHEHIMQFTDTVNPTEDTIIQNISDASSGNYAFMWDYEGRNISHPRDYFIVGYNKETGKQEMPWLEKNIALKFKSSKKDINEFLNDYPTFENQSLKNKPNIEQLVKDGNIGLDCRYLNFAPQCQGWMQLTQDGGYGSFVIFWSKVWKLTTAATIPYYTGQYKNSKRGFGFVTIGANTEEFHSAANEIKDNIKDILETQTDKMKSISDENNSEIGVFIKTLINNLSVLTILMSLLVIIIALWLANYLTSKLKNISIGTTKFSNNDFTYRIKNTNNDEIGKLEQSFNDMASKIESLVQKQKDLNDNLEEKVAIKTEELTYINQHLENEIAKRTKSLNKTLIEVKKADEAKTIFLANMSHEIRTPLNAIIGFSEILSSSQKSDVTTKKQAHVINTSANSLLTIINDILDVSKIENGNFDLHMQEVDLCDISENVIELFSQKAIEKNIKLIFDFEHDIPKSLVSDALRLKQILSNFISNAIKFTPEYGTVTISVHILETTEKQLLIRFEIIDTGIGIKDEDLDNIFNAFIQVNDRANKQYEGTGLGLSICTHIIEALNSEIHVESIEGQGSRFWFDISFKTTTKRQEIPKDLNNLLDQDFAVTDAISQLFYYAKKYLDLFGNVNSDNYNNADIIIETSMNKTTEQVMLMREKYANKPLLVLFEYEEEIEAFNAQENEHCIALPFYASKLNDAIQDLLSKTNKIPFAKKEELEQSFEAKILVAEDNPANQELISYILESMNIEFKIVDNGLEALNIYKEEKFSLILMDINMPIMDGCESFKQIRLYEDENNIETTPIIALTANAIKGDKEKYLEMGMDDYLTKPINTNALNNVFNKYLTKSLSKMIQNELQDQNKDKLLNKTIKAIDVTKVAKNLGMGEGIAAKIIDKFLEDIKKDLHELGDYVKQSNIEEINMKAHYIKNSCLNVCKEKECEILQKLEAKTLTSQEANSLYEELIETI